MMRLLRVVAAVIAREGLVLIAKRKSGRSLAGYWEFPGGKVEPGETPEEALARELFEEFSIRTEVGARIGRSVFQYPEYQVELVAYWARHVSGDFALRDHDEIRWVAPAELSRFLLAPADIPLLKDILALGETPFFRPIR